jgi:hypothetical protein
VNLLVYELAVPRRRPRAVIAGIDPHQLANRARSLVDG